MMKLKSTMIPALVAAMAIISIASQASAQGYNNHCSLVPMRTLHGVRMVQRCQPTHAPYYNRGYIGQGYVGQGYMGRGQQYYGPAMQQPVYGYGAPTQPSAPPASDYRDPYAEIFAARERDTQREFVEDCVNHRGQMYRTPQGTVRCHADAYWRRIPTK